MSENEIFDINELIPGVYLIKEFKNSEKIQNPDYIGIFIYKINLKKMSILNLEVDFTNSKNIQLNRKKFKLNIMPFETKIIAEIYLEKDFEINPKFNFNLFIPEKKIQLKYLQQYEEEKLILYQKVIKEITQYPFEFIDLDEINQILYNLNIKFIDIDFIQNDEALINNNYKKGDLNYIIHWRRPKDFLIEENNEEINGNNYNNIKIFSKNNSPFLNDVKQELFPTNNLDCALNALTEKNNLINRLIINENVNINGIYKIKLCIKGEWITVIIDDYFPCVLFSNPIVSNTYSNDLWVLLIQKALAKSFGNYYNLINISIPQYLNILTGCPTISFNISDLTNNKSDIDNLYNIINDYLNEKNYLIIAISNKNYNNLTMPDMGYTILDIVNQNKNIFIVLRINIFDKKIEKNNDIYKKKIIKKYPSLIEEYNDDNSILIFTIDDFLKEFKNIVVCYTKKWEDIRIRGKFIDIGNDNNNLIISKCFYNINLVRETEIIISLFQDDDEFIFNKNSSRKNTLDISIAILKQDNDTNEISLIKTLDFKCSSIIQIEIKLPPGNYIIFPRTSGCLFGKNILNNRQTIIYDPNTNKFSEIFVNTIKDIFKKFDILLNRYLGFKEFKGFWECIQNDKTINEKYFNNNILNRYQSYLNCITEKGFIDFFKDVYLSKNGKEEINNWLNKLGYDNDLYPLKSRCFMITFNTEVPIKVSVYSTLNTYLYSKIERLVLISNGKKIKEKGDISILQYKSLYNNVFGIGAINNGDKAYVVGVIINKKKGYIFSDKRNKIEKLIEPGKCEFYFYFYCDNNSIPKNIKKDGEINYNNIINLDIDYYSVN